MKTNQAETKSKHPMIPTPPERLNWHTSGDQPAPGNGLTGNYFDELRKESMESLTQEALIPFSKIRPSGCFYEDLKSKSQASCAKVCTGTSCLLCGAKRERQNLKRAGHTCGTVRCLGHCDRSPVTLDEFTLEHADVHTRIRCIAPHPIVTKRILNQSLTEINRALAEGVYSSLPVAFAHTPAELITQIIDSGQRGRGGTAIPTGKKWQSAARLESRKKYVIANGDEGDPGAFIDRILMEEDPHTIIESMILCGYAIGADEGIIYIRSEYPHAITVMNQALEAARSAGFLGENICGSGFSFHIRIFVGVGGYACGEDTALIQSIAGVKRPQKNVPLLTKEKGLYGKPTVINNIETLANVPYIVNNGSNAYHDMGTHASCGTKAICLNAGFEHPGVVEVEYGTTLREIIEQAGGGGRNGLPLAAVLIGGPMGSIVQPKDWDLPLCYDVLDLHGIRMGHGGLIAIPEDTDFKALLEHLIDFSIYESCQKCAHSRRGIQHLKKALQQGKTKHEIQEIAQSIEIGNLSAYGESIPGPITTIINEFGDRIF